MFYRRAGFRSPWADNNWLKGSAYDLEDQNGSTHLPMGIEISCISYDLLRQGLIL